MNLGKLGIKIGRMQSGPLGKITDVPGVTVGHCTVVSENHNTGVSVIMPCQDNPFVNKLPCAAYVLNGFGKTQGLVQVEELGTLETPIALTNTLNIGLVHDAIVDYMVKRNAAEGVDFRSVNPVICECNDGKLNLITERAVNKEHVYKAIDDAKVDFEEGAVGCGRGMRCHGFKGGVGSASRLITIGDKTYTIGVFAQTNHGKSDDLSICGVKVLDYVNGVSHNDPEVLRNVGMDECEFGSCILVTATDLPVSSRQLKRIIKRESVGLARLGSFMGNGSGEVFVGFSTQNRYNPDTETLVDMKIISENQIDECFRAAAECAEEAVLSSLMNAETVTGYSGLVAQSLKDFLHENAPELFK